MTRLRYNGLSTTLGGSGLASGATTAVTFAAALTYNGGTNVPTIVSPDYIPLSILDSSGKLAEIVWLTAYTSGATTGTIARAQEGTTGAARASGLKVVHATTALDSDILAEVEATTSATYTTTATTDADVDATNLSVTFTAPASGNVIVQQEAYCNWSQATGGYEWLVRNAAGTLINALSVTASHAGSHRFLVSHRITGLTPGTSYTYRWGHRRIGASGTGSLYTGGAGGTNGNARMSVHQRP